MTPRAHSVSIPVHSIRHRAPSLRALPFGHSAEGTPVRLLTDRQREHLATIGTPMKVPPRTTLYHEGDTATNVYIVQDGCLKSFRELASGRRHVTSFLFAGDVFGLAEHGKYCNTLRTITRSALYLFAADTLTALFKRDPEIEFQFLCKLTHELRESQRQSIIVARRDASGRLAMFFDMISREGHYGPLQSATIKMPMSRVDIASFVGLSPEAVSRASRDLKARGLVAFPTRDSVKILDRKRFDELVSAT
jgi:CRP-like cAMP-binding protein